ncbi:MAG: hypothetical protein IKK77_01440 [Clostridia bacterium]|jgi:hypothetical protein|nr:hypothetical protein [Clostridia bacterium]
MITELIIEVLSSLMSGLTGVSDTFIELFFRKKQILKEDKKTQETLSKKLEKLTDNLHETSVLMAEIETEFQQQKELAEKWSKEAETSQIIASMSEKEVEAVTKIFGGVLKEDEKKSSRKSWWWNLFFCILGIIGGYLVSKHLL